MEPGVQTQITRKERIRNSQGKGNTDDTDNTETTDRKFMILNMHSKS